MLKWEKYLNRENRCIFFYPYFILDVSLVKVKVSYKAIKKPFPLLQLIQVSPLLHVVTQYITHSSKAIECLSVCQLLFLFFSSNSTETTQPIELKFLGKNPIGVQKVIGHSIPDLGNYLPQNRLRMQRSLLLLSQNLFRVRFLKNMRNQQRLRVLCKHRQHLMQLNKWNFRF